MPPTRPTDRSERLDELYREHPDGFVASRNELAKELRRTGEREQADAVAKLRKPSVPAWLINRAALTSAAETEEFAAASQELERAQHAAVEGADRGGEAYRAAAARERDASESLVRAAESAATDAGHSPSARNLDLVRETLQAAAGDADLRERVLRGRVERQQAAATLGALAAAPGGGRRRAGSEKRREVERARRELRRLEDQLERASARSEHLRAQVEQASDALRTEQEKLAESEREMAALEREVDAARRRAARRRG